MNGNGFNASTSSLQHQARQHAAAAERERIYRDLHDDLGARLLDLVYAAPDPAQAEQARQALQSLRALVADAQRPASTLHLLLGELRAETDRRLRSAGRELLWEQDAALPDMQLDQATTLHLARIMREAVTNALRHAALRWLRVRLYEMDGILLCDVTDDGRFDGRTSAAALARSPCARAPTNWARRSTGIPVRSAAPR
ncbi:MAG: hypothetical protein IPM70_05715 [Proteobacteria bacterium]|nr:hypothetical protein [Pseudomonadota bacterium]